MGNWADLPPEIISFIASKVFEIDSFRLVSKSCKDAVASTTNSVPICLMNYCRPTKSWKFRRGDTSSFIIFPELEDADVRCSKYGWLLMSRSDRTLFFFNPCSNRTIELPHKIGFGYTHVFFTHPPTSPDCTVVGIQTPFVGQFVVEICVLARGGNGTEWETKKHPTKTISSLSHGLPIMHRGQIYFLDVRGNVARFDFINRRLVTTDKCLEISRDDDDDHQIKKHYLFKLKNGRDQESLFSVFVFHDEAGYEDIVKVFRLSEKEMKWKKVEDIGDNVVFLSRVSSFSFPCRSMANRIYFPRLLRGCDSPVFYSLSDAKFHSHLDTDDNNATAAGNNIRTLDLADWVRTTSELNPTDHELTWEISGYSTWKKISRKISTLISYFKS